MTALVSIKFTGIEHNNCAPEHTRTVRKGSEISLQKPSTLEITNTSGCDLEVLLELNAKSELTTPFFIRDQFDNQLLSFKFVLPANFVTNIPLATHYTKPSQEKDAAVRNRSILSFSVFGVGSQQRVASAQLPLKLLHASAKMRKVMYETLGLSPAGLSFTSSTERSPINLASSVLLAQNLLENQGFSPLATGAFGPVPVPADEYSNASTASSSPSGQEHGQAVGFLFGEETGPESPASSSSAFSFTQGEVPQTTMKTDNTEFNNSMEAPQDMTFSSSSSSALPSVSLYSYFCLGDEDNETEGTETSFFYPPTPVDYGCGSFLPTTPFH